MGSVFYIYTKYFIVPILSEKILFYANSLLFNLFLILHFRSQSIVTHFALASVKLFIF